MTTNKLRSKIIASVMVLALVISIVPISSFALPDLYRYTGTGESGNQVAIKLNDVNKNSNTKIFNVKKWSGSSLIGDVYLAYCTDNVTYIKTTEDYYIDHLKNVTYLIDPDRIRSIVKFGYPNVSLDDLKAAVNAGLPNNQKINNLNIEEAIAGTQMAIWKYANGTTSRENGDVQKLYQYLIELDPTASPTLGSILVSGPIVSVVGTDVTIVYSYSTTGTNKDGSPILLSDSSSSSVLADFSRSVNVNAGTTTITLTKPLSDFISESHDGDFEITVGGTQTLYDVYVFNPKNGRDATQTLVSKGFDYANPLNESLEGNLKFFVPPTTVPPTTVPPTTVPPTTVPATTVPATTVPATTVPATTVPETTVPATTVPETTVPETTVPATTVPETTVPETTVPETTVPASTVPETTVPETTVPATTVPETTVPATTVPETPPTPTDPILIERDFDDEPLNNPVVEEVVEEAAPQAPVIEEPQAPVILDVVEVEEVPAQVVPLAVVTLPKTGEIPATLLYSIGGLLGSIGVFMRRKNR